VTEPEAFVLDIYFNAHPIASDSKQKQKATNALVPTSLAYTGGFAEFPVDMGAEVSLSAPFREHNLNHDVHSLLLVS
jgi:hypothetical protein